MRRFKVKFKVKAIKKGEPADYDVKYCVRCGMTQKDVYRLGYGGYCAYYGKSFGNHSYITDRELDKWGEENEI